MVTRRRNPEMLEVHNISIEFSAEGDKKVLDRLLVRVGKLLYNAGIRSISVKDDYIVDYITSETDTE